MNRKDEAEYFKSSINLVDFMRSYGYEIDEKESYGKAIILRGRGDDKLQVIREQDNHWVYFSFRDLEDNGSIFDFVLNRSSHRNFGIARAEIREWTEGILRPYSRLVTPINRVPSTITKFDQAVLIKEFNHFKKSTGHPYLVSRGVNDEIVQSPLFFGQICEDERQNVIFPHRNKRGICGFERKNYSFKGFSEGGIRGLWRSNIPETIEEMVLGESVLDVISYHILFPSNAYYVSTSGGWSPGALELMKHAFDRLPAQARVRLIFDQDDQGRKYTEQVAALCQQLGKAALNSSPEQESYDWNQVLMEKRGLSRS